MADLPRPSFEEIAKALEQKVKDQAVELQLQTALTTTVEHQLADAQTELAQLRAALRTSEESRLQVEQDLTDAQRLMGAMV